MFFLRAAEEFFTLGATVRIKTNCLVSRLLRAAIAITAKLEKCPPPRRFAKTALYSGTTGVSIDRT